SCRPSTAVVEPEAPLPLAFPQRQSRRDDRMPHLPAPAVALLASRWLGSAATLQFFLQCCVGDRAARLGDTLRSVSVCSPHRSREHGCEASQPDVVVPVIVMRYVGHGSPPCLASARRAARTGCRNDQRTRLHTMNVMSSTGSTETSEAHIAGSMTDAP